MVKKIIQYFIISLLCIIIVLALTNPSTNQFKDFIGNPSFEKYTMIYKRTSNWLIFSTYEFSYVSTYPNNDYTQKEIVSSLDELTGIYNGFFLNFHKAPPIE